MMMDRGLAQRFADELGYELVAFRAVDPDGTPIYHTNVMMSVGASVALVCFESIVDSGERGLVRELVQGQGRELVDLSWSQTCAFAGNVLEVGRAGVRPALVLSASAHDALGDHERQRLSERLDLVSHPIPTIERLGGGSARCMVAAVHLPRAT